MGGHPRNVLWTGCYPWKLVAASFWDSSLSLMDEDLEERIHGCVVMDGYDDCILGTCERFGQETIVAYDLDKVLAKLVAEGCTYEEAEEFWAFNQIGAWWGEKTPCFIRTSTE